MFTTYIKTAWRNITRNKAFAALNIFGLATGIAAAMLLFVVIKYELSYNKSFPNYKEVYHLYTHEKHSEGIGYNPGVPYPALQHLRNDFKDVTVGAFVSASGSQITLLSDDSTAIANKKFIEETGMFFADPQFFQIFQYKWLSGNGNVLEAPNTVALTRSVAEKYYGDWQSAVGKLMQIDNAIPLRVTGILEDVPVNTDYNLSVVASFATVKNNLERYDLEDDWGSLGSDFQVFMSLPPGREKTMASQLVDFTRKRYEANANTVRTIMLQPLAEVHYDARLGNFADHTISMSTIWTLGLIGVFILVMACINFINLSTAQAINRSKEIGIRKVLGGQRSSLFWQVMGETAMIVGIAFIIAIGIAAACLPFISHVASIKEELTLFAPVTLLFALVIAVLITFLSGSYPALIVSGFKPILALKNKITSATIGGISLRRALVVLQFAISQALIIGTIVAVTQMSFVKTADLGFNKEAVLMLSASADSTIRARQPAMKQDLLNLSGVESVSFNSDAPSSDNNWATNFAFDHQDDKDYALFLKFGDADYFKTFGVQFAAGTGYAATDTIKDVVINEALSKKLGLASAQDAIGKDIRMGRQQWRKIVGVVKDFKTNSLREEVKPMLIGARKSVYNNTAIKINSSNLAATKEAIQKVWDKHLPAYANTSFYVDENIENFYRQETQLSLLYKIFAGIAIFISCLGLYGLVSFMAAQRKKEVGVRKVLGASVGNIVYLFSKEFTILILIAFVIAAPLAWYIMSNWLNNFAYRIHIGAGIFAAAMLLTILLAWLTVGYKSVKAAMANPVKSLRSE